MKKVLSIILTLAALIIFLITFSACNIIAPEHTHSLTQVAKKEATCTEDGVGAYYACSKCDKIFADAEGKNEMETPEVIFATGHIEVVDKGIAPTCTESGLTDGKHCSVCGRVIIARDPIDALGHDWSDELTDDENGAFYECNNGCGERREYSEDIELTIMSFNIRLNTSSDGNNAWPKRKANVINYINSAEFDVMCLQEVVTSQYNDIKAGLDSKYTIIHYERQGAGSEGLAIIYNNETFNLVEQNRFWLSATPEIQSLGWGASYYRICVNLLLEHKATGAKIDVYNVHLDHQVETARINGIDLILERAARRDYPLVLAGDFNCTSTSATHGTANAYLKDCQEESPLTEYGMTHQGFVRYENTDEGNAIDFIFVDEANMTPTFFEIIDEYPSDTEFYSDHFAIRSVVKLIVDERVTKDYEKQEYSSSIDNDFVSDKEYTLDMVYGSGDGWSVTTNGAVESGYVENGIGTLNALGKYVDYEFYLAEDGVVDLIWSIAANSAITDMSSQLVITIDGIPVNVFGKALSTDYQLLVIEDIELSAGAHHFTCNVIASGGVKVEKLTIKSSSAAILRSSFVTGADIYLENGRLYYTLTFENNGFSANEYLFFNDGGIVVEYMKAEEKDGTIIFTFDFTDRNIGSRFNPHALVGGKVYINGANSVGDVRGSKLVFTAEEIALGDKLFKLFKNYSMPTVDVIDNRTTYVFDVATDDPFLAEKGGSFGNSTISIDGYCYENTKLQTFTVTVSVSKATDVIFMVRVARNGQTEKISDLFTSATINGENVIINTEEITGKGWSSPIDAVIATLSLKEGNNVITFTRGDAANGIYNFNVIGISFKSSVPVRVGPLHTCSYGDYAVITAPTYTAEGQLMKKCATCGESDEESTIILPTLSETNGYTKVSDTANEITWAYTHEGKTFDIVITKYATVKSADMYLQGDKVYYKLVYESLYAPEAFDFFYKETDYVHTSCTVDGLMLTFIFDITDTAHLVPHLRINGSNYGHKNGDVLFEVAGKTIEFNGKKYVFSTWYDMPSVWISSVE